MKLFCVVTKWQEEFLVVPMDILDEFGYVGSYWSTGDHAILDIEEQKDFEYCAAKSERPINIETVQCPFDLDADYEDFVDFVVDKCVTEANLAV